MQEPWQGEMPIYLQLRERIVAMILEGELRAGEAIPSVRQIAADYRINPLTVTKAYEGLAEENIVEKRRGLGLFVTDTARDQLQHKLRDQFLNEEWPRILKRIQQLGLSPAELLPPTSPQES